MEIKAYAKINLALDVVRRRDDGYHEVKMIMQTVDICDELTLTAKDEGGITISVNVPGIPCNEDNLVYKAARLLMDEFNITKGLNIDLVKNIPSAAGMAGGSADAAAVLKGVNEIFALGLSIEELKKRGVRIGADVPYCIMQGTALSEGIGEILTPLPGMPECHILVAKPPIDVSTKYVYENLHANELKYHPDVDGAVLAIKAADLDGIASHMENVLETVTERENPVITEIKNICKANGAINALMSGSGPTVFALYRPEDIDKAEEAMCIITDSSLCREVFLTRPLN